MPVGVLVANLFALGLLYAYTHLNLRPFLPAHDTVMIFGQPMVVFIAFCSSCPRPQVSFSSGLYCCGLAVASRMRRSTEGRTESSNAPVVLGIFTAAVWALVGVVTLAAGSFHTLGTDPWFAGAFFCPSDPYGFDRNHRGLFHCRAHMPVAGVAGNLCKQASYRRPGYLENSTAPPAHHVLGHYQFSSAEYCGVDCLCAPGDDFGLY